MKWVRDVAKRKSILSSFLVNSLFLVNSQSIILYLLYQCNRQPLFQKLYSNKSIKFLRKDILNHKLYQFILDVIMHIRMQARLEMTFLIKTC